jgi:hypothetical protein
MDTAQVLSRRRWDSLHSSHILSSTRVPTLLASSVPSMVCSNPVVLLDHFRAWHLQTGWVAAKPSWWQLWCRSSEVLFKPAVWTLACTLPCALSLDLELVRTHHLRIHNLNFGLVFVSQVLSSPWSLYIKVKLRLQEFEDCSSGCMVSSSALDMRLLVGLVWDFTSSAPRELNGASH